MAFGRVGHPLGSALELAPGQAAWAEGRRAAPYLGRVGELALSAWAQRSWQADQLSFHPDPDAGL